MKISVPVLLLAACIVTAFKSHSLRGNYKYVGGIYNGKAEQGNTGYILQRNYGDTNFDAFLLEPKQQPFKYQSGVYNILGDTCLETETFSAQPSKLTGKTISYHYEMSSDTLKLNGILPNGNRVEEHWLKTGK